MAFCAGFNVFDKDKSGFICREELRQVMINLGEQVTEDQLDEMMDEADINKDGKVSFEEFEKLMFR